VHCRFFWFRWKDYRLQVGEGTVIGEGLLMQHTKDDHPQDIISIGLTTGWESIGDWEIVTYEGVHGYLIIMHFLLRGLHFCPSEHN